MFNLQGSEIIFILLLALVVLGPEKLPSAIRRFTQTYTELKKMGSGFQTELKSALDEPMREMKETAGMIRDSADPSKMIADAERDSSSTIEAERDAERQLRAQAIIEQRKAAQQASTDEKADEGGGESDDPASDDGHDSAPDDTAARADADVNSSPDVDAAAELDEWDDPVDPVDDPQTAETNSDDATFAPEVAETSGDDATSAREMADEVPRNELFDEHEGSRTAGPEQPSRNGDANGVASTNGDRAPTSKTTENVEDVDAGVAVEEDASA